MRFTKVTMTYLLGGNFCTVLAAEFAQIKLMHRYVRKFTTRFINVFSLRAHWKAKCCSEKAFEIRPRSLCTISLCSNLFSYAEAMLYRRKPTFSVHWNCSSFSMSFLSQNKFFRHEKLDVTVRAAIKRFEIKKRGIPLIRSFSRDKSSQRCILACTSSLFPLVVLYQNPWWQKQFFWAWHILQNTKCVYTCACHAARKPLLRYTPSFIKLSCHEVREIKFEKAWIKAANSVGTKVRMISYFWEN